MYYSLYKINDKSCGDSGPMSCVFSFNDQEVKFEHNARPRVGVYLRVGSNYARFMEKQDWWQTNEITEILEDTDNYVKFRTKSNSIYEWKIV